MITLALLIQILMVLAFAYSLYCYIAKHGDSQYPLLVAIFLVLVLIWIRG